MTFHFRHAALRLFIIALLLPLAACDSTSESSGQSSADVFLKADPPVNAELEFAPGSLRVFFSQLPNVDASSMSLTGAEGDVPLSGLHTMGEDDLMIGIVQYPLAPGEYTVQWTTRFKEDGQEFSGSYNFILKAGE